MTGAASPPFGSPSAAGPLGAGWPAWRRVAVGLVSLRFIQGFIYWGGGSRRFIYAPNKLDPDSPHWMANKFQSAMPGAILGTDHLIAWLLHHFWALYPALIVFSALELLCGLGLIAGALTRLSALGTIFFSVALMLTFGWQGATCIDEWTMAASNLAMGVTLVLLGSGAWSLDALALRRWPGLERRGWFRWTCGAAPLPITDRGFSRLALGLLAFTVVFSVATYSYYRGSVVTPFHSGPVSPSKPHYTLSDATLDPQGSVRVHLYLDGGTPAVPSHLMKAELVDGGGAVVESWDATALSTLPEAAIRNDFTFNRVKPGPYGLVSEVGAEASIALPGRRAVPVSPGLTLRVTDVEGKTFRANVQQGSPS